MKKVVSLFVYCLVFGLGSCVEITASERSRAVFVDHGSGSARDVVVGTVAALFELLQVDPSAGSRAAAEFRAREAQQNAAGGSSRCVRVRRKSDSGYEASSESED